VILFKLKTKKFNNMQQCGNMEQPGGHYAKQSQSQKSQCYRITFIEVFKIYSKSGKTYNDACHDWGEEHMGSCQLSGIKFQLFKINR
jgi:hypothetical protein